MCLLFGCVSVCSWEVEENAVPRWRHSFDAFDEIDAFNKLGGHCQECQECGHLTAFYLFTSTMVWCTHKMTILIKLKCSLFCIARHQSGYQRSTCRHAFKRWDLSSVNVEGLFCVTGTETMRTSAISIYLSFNDGRMVFPEIKWPKTFSSGFLFVNHSIKHQVDKLQTFASWKNRSL